MTNCRLLSFFFAMGLLADGNVSRCDEDERSRVDTFVRQYCVTCHSGDAPEGSLDLTQDTPDLLDAEVRRRWVYFYDRVADGEMPPEGERQPDQADRAEFLKALGSALTHADLESQEVVLRRLNRNEYQNTVRDLFDIYVDLTNVLPDDSVEQGFDTIGSGLYVSAEQMMSYLEAADLVLDEVFGPSQAPARIDQIVNFKDLRSKTTADRVEADGVVLFSGAKTLPMYGVSVRGPASYRLRVEVKAVQSKRPVIMRAEGGVTGRVPAHVAGFFEVPPGELTTIEWTDRAIERDDTFAFGLVGGFPWWSVNAEQYEGPGLFLGDIHIEGPLEEWPRRSYRKLMGDIDPKQGTLQDVRAVLARLLPRAFRRVTDNSDAAPYVRLAQQALERDRPFEDALRRSLKGMLCAPEFLYLEERKHQSDDRHAGAVIDDFALASRLSYFLWSSLPDEELYKLAARDGLHEPSVLQAQVERMLDDPRSARFVESFTGQWLKLRDIDFTVPNDRLYPEYNQLLRQSMLDETHAFFREILTHNHSVQNFIDSEFAMLNGPLAEFYGIDGVDGLAVRRVELPSESLRGGVLTQASVLKVSADGTRTSPTLRGAWVLKNLFGDPPAPPPPTIDAIEPDIRGATTVREQLALHRSHESCNRWPIVQSTLRDSRLNCST